MCLCKCVIDVKIRFNKKAFQQDAYRPLIDRMLESASGGGVYSRGCLLPGVVSVPGGVCSRGCLLWGGDLLPRGGSAPGGLSAPGGVCSWGGVWSGGLYPSMH